MSKPEIGGGVVEIELDGKVQYLVPTLEACIEISKSSGGLQGAVQRLNAMHFETMCMVIGTGLRIDGKALNPRQRDDLVPGAVFRAGLIHLAPACIRFCTIIANGGRPLVESEDLDEDQEGEGEGGDAPLG
jgi:hypothetical protein